MKRLTDEQSRFVAENHRLAYHFAWRRHLTAYIDFDEILSAAYLGLCQARIMHNKDRKTRFSTTAYFYMHKHFLKARSDSFAIRGHCGRVRPLPLGAESIAGGPESRPFDEIEAMDVALSSLPRRMRSVVERRVLREETLEAIGADLGVSRERVRQIEGQGLRKLRRILSRSDKSA
jgi:RNA polymerase sigma factor (sigma-70 family)